MIIMLTKSKFLIKQFQKEYDMRAFSIVALEIKTPVHLNYV